MIVPTPWLVAALAAYVLAVLGLGLAATRRAARSPEEYFLAGKGLGRAVLFMALFGTNCTAFVLVGVPGLAYHQGVGVFGLNAPIVALGIPLSFWAVGVPARRHARRLGALTPAELYGRLLGSRGVAVALFAVFTLYTVPYMVTAVDGAATTLREATGGAVGSLAGGVAVLALALGYTALGGMRATAWTNVLQGCLFLGFMVLAFFLVPRELGGLTEATRRVAEVDGGRLLVRGSGGLQAPAAFASWSLVITLTVIAFPHMLVRLVAADSERTLRDVSRLYPFALVLLWVPAVLLGVWGAVRFPGLVGRESDRVFSLLAGEVLPPWLGLWGVVAVLAAVMSTLDAQLLTLGSMLTRDVLPKGEPGAAEDRREVRLGRWFALLVALVVLVLWRLAGSSIFAMAGIAFSGYVTLAPTLLLGVRWSRFSATGALLSLALGNAVYWVALAGAPELGRAALTPSWLGFLPAFWGLAAATLGAWLGSVLRPRRA